MGLCQWITAGNKVRADGSCPGPALGCTQMCRKSANNVTDWLLNPGLSPVVSLPNGGCSVLK